MTGLVKNDSSAAPRPATSSPARILQAELDYYDALGRFGHNSAEAHVARIVWRRLQSV